MQQRYASVEEANLFAEGLHKLHRCSEFLMTCDALDSRSHGSNPQVCLPLGAVSFAPECTVKSDAVCDVAGRMCEEILARGFGTEAEPLTVLAWPELGTKSRHEPGHGTMVTRSRGYVEQGCVSTAARCYHNSPKKMCWARQERDCVLSLRLYRPAQAFRSARVSLCIPAATRLAAKLQGRSATSHANLVSA